MIDIFLEIGSPVSGLSDPAPHAGAVKRKSDMEESKELVASGSREMRQYDVGDVADYLVDYGNTESITSIVGTLLKFNKGEYLLGQEEVEVEVGTRYVVLMDQVTVGWVKWENSKPVNQMMGFLFQRFKPAERSDLGDNDKSQWEEDANGKPRDPWQKSNHLVMCVPGEDRDDRDNLVTFATSSSGGRNAVANFLKSVGKEMRLHPDEWPVLELRVSKYKHSVKEYGIIKVPVLEHVGWEPRLVGLPKGTATVIPPANKAETKAASGKEEPKVTSGKEEPKAASGTTKARGK